MFGSASVVHVGAKRCERQDGHYDVTRYGFDLYELPEPLGQLVKKGSSSANVSQHRSSIASCPTPYRKNDASSSLFNNASTSNHQALHAEWFESILRATRLIEPTELPGTSTPKQKPCKVEPGPVFSGVFQSLKAG